MEKPVAQLSGQNGNVFNLMGICKRALERNGQREQGKELVHRITTSAKSYDDALAIMAEYVDII